MICAIVCSFTDGNDSTGVLIRMVCGLFLTIVAIRPVTSLNYEWLEDFAAGFNEMASVTASLGSDMADEARREIIKAETEAYILDIASSYGLQLQVRVTLAEGDVPVPEAVYLTGIAAPAAKERLRNTIANDLNIPKERQLWSG